MEEEIELAEMKGQQFIRKVNKYIKGGRLVRFSSYPEAILTEYLSIRLNLPCAP